MLFKMSLLNIRKSIKDYAVYFFTLLIGVSVFYVFNAIGTQSVYLTVSADTREIIGLMETTLSGVSVFVSVVLGLLIVYAGRFLMKRRSREFAVYMLLGMGKGRISALLLCETFIIGIGSLFAGLVLGMGLSQLMSAFVADLFEADMTEYRFTVSWESVIKTLIYFGIMYGAVMIFNTLMIGKARLITLMQSDKRTEKMPIKNPALCVVIFILAAAGLGYAYHTVTHNINISENTMLAMIALGSVTTFLIYYSVSGLLLTIASAMKGSYYKGLNAFTFRQISAKINTTVMSMTVICLMLFVAICTLSSAFTVRNSMNANLNSLCPADFQIDISLKDKETEKLLPADIISGLKKQGYDIQKETDSFTELYIYHTEGFDFGASFGSMLESVRERFFFLDYTTPEDIVTLSDYNRLMELYGRETEVLTDDEFILVCDFDSMTELRNTVLENGESIDIFGKMLHSKYDRCSDGFLELAAQHINAGFYVVPDSLIPDGTVPAVSYLTGNYAAADKSGRSAAEERLSAAYENMRAELNENEILSGAALNTRIDISEAAVGLGGIAALIGLYIGIVFLISCGAVLALKELSDSADSIGRYDVLRKIGAEEKDIYRSLFAQTEIFFLLPMLLAAIHSVFGMQFAVRILEVFGTDEISASVIFTSVLILIIYGGYFLITYFCSRSMISGKR